VLNDAYQYLPRTVEKIDAQDALSSVWLRLRVGEDSDPSAGIRMHQVASIIRDRDNVFVTIDSAPRGAAIHITPSSAFAGPLSTRDTVILRAGTAFKIRFSMPGYRDKEESLLVDSGTSFFCQELNPSDRLHKKFQCPSK